MKPAKVCEMLTVLLSSSNIQGFSDMKPVQIYDIFFLTDACMYCWCEYAVRNNPDTPLEIDRFSQPLFLFLFFFNNFRTQLHQGLSQEFGFVKNCMVSAWTLVHAGYPFVIQYNQFMPDIIPGAFNAHTSVR